MGPSHAREQDDSLKALLREKDDRIATLERRLEAYTARASTAQTRLLKTIDVLDALRAQHALDMSAEESAKTKLAREANRWRTVARNLEVDRDELKDVVEDLIEKAGCTSRSMQRGDLNVAFPEQVVVGTTIDDERTTCDRDDDLLAYATAIIARLRMELDVERQNHGKTVEEANLRIEELEAKVAVREAELERCVITVGDDIHTHPPRNVATASALEEPELGKRLPEPKLLSDEECLRFLESNSARNRSLEIEIRHIAERLEQARMAAPTPSDSHKTPAPQNGHKAVPTPSPRPRSASVDPSALSRPSDAADSTPTPASPSTKLSITQLDNQIRTLTTHVDALVSERRTLTEASARQRRAAEGTNMDTFQDVLRVEDECVRLQAEVDDLRKQLQKARTSARGRESTLLCEIALLRASASNSAAHADPSLLQPLEDELATEEAMELASPLTPTIVPIPNPVHPSLNVGLAETETEMDLVSLPFSPQYVSSPPPNAPVTPFHSEIETLHIEVQPQLQGCDGEDGDGG